MVALTRKQRSAKHRAKDPEKANQYLREWRAKNKEKVKKILKKNTMKYEIDILKAISGKHDGLTESQIKDEIRGQITDVRVAIHDLWENRGFIEQNDRKAYTITISGSEYLIAVVNTQIIPDKIIDESPEPELITNELKENQLINRALQELKQKLEQKTVTNKSLKISVLKKLIVLLDISIAEILESIIQQDLE